MSDRRRIRVRRGAQATADALALAHEQGYAEGFKAGTKKAENSINKAHVKAVNAFQKKIDKLESYIGSLNRDKLFAKEEPKSRKKYSMADMTPDIESLPDEDDEWNEGHSEERDETLEGLVRGRNRTRRRRRSASASAAVEADEGDEEDYDEEVDDTPNVPGPVYSGREYNAAGRRVRRRSRSRPTRSRTT